MACVCYHRTKLYSLPPFSLWFSSTYFDANVDAVVSKHVDTLGHDLSVRGWD